MNEIEIKFIPQERDLIIDHHTFADPELTKRLKIAEIKGKHLIAKYLIHDLDDLLGFIAADANHTVDEKLEKKLDKLTRIIEKYL